MTPETEFNKPGSECMYSAFIHIDHVLTYYQYERSCSTQCDNYHGCAEAFAQREGIFFLEHKAEVNSRADFWAEWDCFAELTLDIDAGVINLTKIIQQQNSPFAQR